jgi:hypothetical protein
MTIPGAVKVTLKEALMFDIDACEAASDPLRYMHAI